MSDATTPATEAAQVEETSAVEEAATPAPAAKAPVVEEPVVEPDADSEPVTDNAPVADDDTPVEEAATEVAVVDETVTEPAAGETPVVAEAPAAELDADSEPVTDNAPVADDDTAEEAPTVDKAAADKASPAAKPVAAAPAKPKKAGPRPSPAPRPRPATPSAAHVPPPTVDPAAVAAAEKHGRVDDEGKVYVIEAAGEREVGQVPGAATPSAAMSLYVRRYLDLDAKVSLFAARLDATDLAIGEIDKTLSRLKAETAEPAAVGDLDALRAKVTDLADQAAAKRAELEKARAEAKTVATVERTAIVEKAETIANGDPAKIQWRTSGEEIRQLLDAWKNAQRNGPRIDRSVEDDLWKRFSAARTTFDRGRRHYFSELEASNTAAKSAKEALVAEAEKLSASTEWGATTSAYRDLMNRWKAAGRANRKDDDALWAKFRAAQDAFFAARDAQNAVIDAEYGENLAAKEALLTEAEAILPVKDLAAAKASLRTVQDKWEKIGKVPRGDVQRVEGRMRAVETAVRDAEQAKWVRTNPETRARAEGAAAQLEKAIDALEVDLAAAKKAGNTKKVAEIEASITARKGWLEQVVKAAEESRG
ncbi:MAG: DUF349 domain-containing protein [Cellulomonadaceae bacterium]|nr:DUF349 domain-containing protein [Cellulomonadaceae bacterium]